MAGASPAAVSVVVNSRSNGGADNDAEDDTKPSISKMVTVQDDKDASKEDKR